MSSVISAVDAAGAIGDDGAATYVDVRTVAEFVQGRPRGRAINVPLVFHHPTTGAEHDNDAFALVVEHTLGDRGQAIVVGADNSERGARAAERLTELGYGDVRLLEGGIEAWREAGLPVTGDNRDGVSYVSLLTPARRAKK